MTLFSATRGAHAPDDLRQLFAEELLVFGDVSSDAVPDDVEDTAGWVIGQLWNCTDTMPSAACRDLDLPAGSSYAQGVRRWRAF